MQIEFLRSGTNGSSCSKTFFKIGLQPSSFIKRRLQHGCFPVDIAKFSGTAFSYTHSLSYTKFKIKSTSEIEYS